MKAKKPKNNKKLSKVDRSLDDSELSTPVKRGRS